MFSSNCFDVTRGKQEEEELGESVNSLKPLVLIRAEFKQKIR